MSEKGTTQFDWNTKASEVFADAINAGTLPTAKRNETSRKYGARLKSEGFEDWKKKLAAASGASEKAVDGAVAYKPTRRKSSKKTTDTKKTTPTTPPTPNPRPPKPPTPKPQASKLSPIGEQAAKIVGEEFLALHEQELIEFALTKLGKIQDS